MISTECFWSEVQKRFANALKGAGRLARIEDGAPDFSGQPAATVDLDLSPAANVGTA
jgi:hypothetical protein